MNTDPGDNPVCPECGQSVDARDAVCSKCQASEPQKAWEKERNRLKNLWIFATLFFWFSLVFQISLFILDGSLNLIIVSIIGGTMVLGFVLKIRLNLHLRKEPGN